MSVAVVIVAAGRGRRLGGELPKQYIPLDGACALRRSVDLFLALPEVNWVVTVTHPDDSALLDEALRGQADPRLLDTVHGADTRAKSTLRGLERLEPLRPDLVLIHDAARPFLPPAVALSVIDALEGSDGACAALPVVDSLWKADGTRADHRVERDGLWRSQTPQGFDFGKIIQAHRQHDGMGSDDVTVAREAGLSVRLVLGSESNYKITTAEDLGRALSDARQLDAQRPQTGQRQLRAQN